MKKLLFLILFCTGCAMAASAELEEELSQVALIAEGEIPNWLSGTLVRNGPITVTVDDKSNEHLFDGLAMLHTFTFHNGQVNYTNRFLRTDAYRTVFEEKSLKYPGFAVDPCRSIFKNFMTWFFPHGPVIHNANVNVAKLADQYVALTERPLPVRFHPETLETLGVLDYQDDLPKDQCWESAHPHYDRLRSETINYLVEYGRTSYYTLYHIIDQTSERDVIAQIPVEEPAYMHSFALTENYVIFTEFPFVVKPLDLILKGQPFIKNFAWKPEKKTQFLVVDRCSGDIVGKYETEPFFAFHHANAYEEGDRIYLDIVCYEDASIISSDVLKPDSKGSKPDFSIRLQRFTLFPKTGEASSELIFKKEIEFPRINEAFDGKPYHFVYLVELDLKETENISRIYKIDTATQERMEWAEQGCFPGEPVFVAKPDADKEDEGVILTVVHDRRNQDSFLLILDGETFAEIGRARVSHVIPAGLHGQYFN